MTSRQQRAVHNLVENGGNRGEALIKAGYSKAMAKTPNKVFKSKGVQEEIDRQLRLQGSSIKKDMAVLIDAQKATKVHIVGNGESAMAEVVTDHPTRIVATKELLKLKGAYTKPNIVMNQPNFNNYAPIDANANDEELIAQTFIKDER